MREGSKRFFIQIAFSNLPTYLPWITFYNLKNSIKFVFLTRLDRNAPVAEEPKFIVFCRKLMQLFLLFCFNSKVGNTEVELLQNGTMITMHQNFERCGKKSFSWQSQPFMVGRYPAGNVLLSFGILTAGASISKVILMFKNMGLTVEKARTYFLHQCQFLFPAILHHWANYKSSLTEEMKCETDVTICGDASFDSMGALSKLWSLYNFLHKFEKDS